MSSNRVQRDKPLLEFPDAETARNWHGSEEYKPWLESRQAGAKSEMLLIDAL